MSINIDKIRSPQRIFILYLLASCFLIMVFRYIFPGSEEPIKYYFRDWRLVKGLLELFSWYPALALSALVIPFGLVTAEENYQSFSEVFFKRLLVSVVTAICAAVIYALIFFLAFPMVKNSEENMRTNGELFKLSKFHAQECKYSGEWMEASQFLSVCDKIWPNSPEVADLRIEIEINLEKVQSKENLERYLARTALERDLRNTIFQLADVSVLSGSQPVNAAQAISMGTIALNERRYYDAHWLFTLGGRLAVPGSPEAVNAARMASSAWNLISSQAPNLREERLHELFNTKLSGYQAMNTGDWIRAYYIFLELSAQTPDDPDVRNFLAASERGAKETAFFIDEIELSVGEILSGAIFSLPGSNERDQLDARAVLRFSSLTTFDDVAYGTEFEYMSFNENSRLTASARSRYAKILPFALNGKQQVLVLSHAIDRYDEKNNYNSEWLVGNGITGGILLNISFEDLLLLSQVRRGLNNLNITELFVAAEKFGSAGYIYQIFQAEILNRIGSTIFFLPIAILIIILGWRYRVKMRPRYLFVIMLAVLPVVFLGLIYLYRSVFNTLGIWLVLSMGFGLALTIYIVTMAVFLFISLIVLSAQHA